MQRQTIHALIETTIRTNEQEVRDALEKMHVTVICLEVSPPGDEP